MAAPSADVPHDDPITNSRLNALRAAVLGANDGVVSVASIILGVAGATDNRAAILASGVAGLVAGALSMAAGEYVSVSSQRDTEKAYISQEKLRLESHPVEEFEELAKAYEARGLSSETAHQVAKELTAHDAVKAHLDAELHLNEDDLSSPTGAAVSSLLAFTAGGIVPLGVVMLVSHEWRFIATFVSVAIALVITGYISAGVGRAPRLPAIIRVLIGGAAAMLITYAAGRLFGRIV